jgi:hypothetical protein
MKTSAKVLRVLLIIVVVALLCSGLTGCPLAEERQYIAGYSPVYNDDGTINAFRSMELVKEIFLTTPTADNTFDMATGKAVSYQSGYQATFERSTRSYTEAEYNELVLQLEHIASSKAEIGVYGVPEISFHFDSLSDAMEVAKLYNQETIFDWGSGDIIFNPDFDIDKD